MDCTPFRLNSVTVGSHACTLYIIAILNSHIFFEYVTSSAFNIELFPAL